MPDSEAEVRDMIKSFVQRQQLIKHYDLSIKGRLGIVIDGTGRDYDKINYQVRSIKTIRL